MKKLGRKPAAVAALALAAGTLASPAFAGTQVSITHDGFSQTPIEVISEDGKTWTTIKQKDLVLSAKLGIGKNDNSVVGYMILNGNQPFNIEVYNGTYGWDNIPHLFKQNYGAAYVPNVFITQPVKVPTHTLSPGEKSMIRSVCNKQLGVGAGIHQTHKVWTSVHLRLGAIFLQDGGNQSNSTGHGSSAFPVAVVCKGVRKTQDELVAEQPKKLKVRGIELFRTTYVGQYSRPNPATKCKKAKLLVRLKTNKAGPVKFRLWTKIGNNPMTSKLVDAWSSHSGPGQYQASYNEWVTVNKTSYVQAKAEETVSTFGMSTPWKSITLHCTGAGGGGLADKPQTDHDAPLIQPLKVTGQLTLADKAGAPKDKPRLGAAVFKLWATKSGATSYRLTCTGGRQWTGTLNTFKVANKKYQAVGQHTFQIDKTERVACALRSTSVNGNPVVALASKQFLLIKRNPQIGDLPEDLRDPKQPTTERPTTERPNKLKDKREKLRKLAELKRKRAKAKREAERKRKAAELRRKRAKAKKAAELRRKRAAAKKAAELRRKRAAELRRKRAKAKKQAELRRKRQQAAKRAAELRRKRQAARRAAQQRKRQQLLRAKRRGLKLRRKRK